MCALERELQFQERHEHPFGCYTLRGLNCLIRTSNEILHALPRIEYRLVVPLQGTHGVGNRVLVVLHRVRAFAQVTLGVGDPIVELLHHREETSGRTLLHELDEERRRLRIGNITQRFVHVVGNMHERSELPCRLVDDIDAMLTECCLYVRPCEALHRNSNRSCGPLGLRHQVAHQPERDQRGVQVLLQYERTARRDAQHAWEVTEVHGELECRCGHAIQRPTHVVRGVPEHLHGLDT